MPFEPFPQPAGAECVFLGRTRLESHPDHGPLTRLIYEAYAPMAESIMLGLARGATSRFGCLAIRLHHALGAVPIGEASVLVQVVAGHRDAAFDGCRFLIDRVKAEAPIWKREQWADGATWSRGTVVNPEAAR